MYFIRKFVRDEIIKSQSSFTNLQGLFLRTTSKIANAEIEHFDRRFGKSGYNFKKLFHLLASLLNYSLKPIRLIEKLGVFVFILGILYLFFACVFGGGFEHKIFAEIWIFSGLILTAVGIVGEYVARMFMALTNYKGKRHKPCGIFAVNFYKLSVIKLFISHKGKGVAKAAPFIWHLVRRALACIFLIHKVRRITLSISIGFKLCVNIFLF